MKAYGPWKQFITDIMPCTQCFSAQASYYLERYIKTPPYLVAHTCRKCGHAATEVELQQPYQYRPECYRCNPKSTRQHLNVVIFDDF